MKGPQKTHGKATARLSCEGGQEASLELLVADTRLARLRGLLGRRGSQALLLTPCRDIHTFGMTSPIDVAFVSYEGVVIEAFTDVGPFKRLRNAGASYVVERFSTHQAPWLLPGQQLVIERASD